MKLLKFMKRALCLCLCLLLLVGVLPARAAEYKSEYVDADGKSTYIWTDNQGYVNIALTASLAMHEDSDTPSEAAEFKFVLVPDNDSYPMPEASEVTIEEVGEIQFQPIKFEKQGTYTYTLYQEEGADENYTYDDTKYGIKVTAYQSRSVLYAYYTCYKIEQEESDPAETEAEASQEPETSQQPEETAPEKVSAMVFVNSYEKPYVPPYYPSTPTPTPTPETSPEPSEEPSENPEASPEPSEEPEVSPNLSEDPGEEPEESPKPSEEAGPVTSPEVSPNPSGENPSPSPSGGKPGKNTGSSVKPTPKTGDDTDNSLWITMLCVAAVGIVGCMIYLVVPKKRRHR